MRFSQEMLSSISRFVPTFDQMKGKKTSPESANTQSSPPRDKGIFGHILDVISKLRNCFFKGEKERKVSISEKDIPVTWKKTLLQGIWVDVFRLEFEPGGPKWVPVSDDLILINAFSIENSIEDMICIAGFDSNHDKVWESTLVPGMKLLAATEKFIYWKDPHSRNVWAVNFMSSYYSNQFKSISKEIVEVIEVCRLWVEAYQVEIDPEGPKWIQIGDDLIEISIFVIKNSKRHVLSIAGYNCDNEKVLDITLVPGMEIVYETDIFIHFEDPNSKDIVGLNFVSYSNAKRFKKMCESVIKSAK